MKTILLAIVTASLIAFSGIAQPLPGSYGYGTFLSYDPEFFLPIPFYGTPAYLQSSDAVYAVSGPDNYGSPDQADDFSYSVSSDLNATPIYQDLLESPGSQDGDSTTSRASAVGNDGTTYVVTPSGILYAINPDGSAKWSYYGPNQNGLGVYASPTIGLDGNVYIATDDPGGVFYCIDPDLGLPKWILRLTNPNGSGPPGYLDIDGSPLFTTNGIYDVDESGFLHYITFYGQEYTALQIGNGEYGGSSSPAITPQGYLCICTAPDGSLSFGSANLVIVDPKPKDLRGQGVVQALFTPDQSGISASPVIGSDGNIYVGTTEGEFYAIQLDPETEAMSIIASNNLGLFPYPTTAAVGSDNEVYVGASSDSIGSSSSYGSFSAMHLVPSSPGQQYSDQFVVDWQTNISPSTPGGESVGGGFVASPLIAQVGASHNQNVVYEPNVNGNLYAFFASAGPSTTTWSTFQGNDQRQGNWGSGPITPPNLWNIQFGAQASYPMTGKAAYGNSSTDFWSLGFAPNTIFPPAGQCFIVTNYTGIYNAGFHCVVVPFSPVSSNDWNGVNVAPANDPFDDGLMKNYLTARGSPFTLVLGAPSSPGFNSGPALYDIYVYAYGGQATYQGTRYSFNSQISISTPGTDPFTGQPVSKLTTSSSPPPNLTQFIEGQEYVVFRNVSFTNLVEITVSKDPSNPLSYPLINGIQFVAKQ